MANVNYSLISGMYLYFYVSLGFVNSVYNQREVYMRVLKLVMWLNLCSLLRIEVLIKLMLCVGETE